MRGFEASDAGQEYGEEVGFDCLLRCFEVALCCASCRERWLLRLLAVTGRCGGEQAGKEKEYINIRTDHDDTTPPDLFIAKDFHSDTATIFKFVCVFLDLG